MDFVDIVGGLRKGRLLYTTRLIDGHASRFTEIMRLTKLKIAGFKSFVDPTNVTFPSSLTGVVGPNGCGKSNIIDAVRCVRREISAKHLRRECLTHAMFKG